MAKLVTVAVDGCDRTGYIYGMEGIHPLKAYRDREGLTQKQLADLLSVERTTVARWETETRRIDHELLSKISETTGIPAKELRPDLAEVFKSVEAAE